VVMGIRLYHVPCTIHKMVMSDHPVSGPVMICP
jgi:hypothetical protein